MLRACHRVLKPGAPLSYFVVAVADGLSDGDTARAVEVGPAYVAAGPGYLELMHTAGFDTVDVVDVTDAYAVTLSDSIGERDVEADQLVDLLGAADFAEGQSSRRHELAAVHEGLLRRYLISAGRR